MDAQADVVERGWDLTIITIAVMLATLMQTLDTTIVNVALPIIQGNLGATLDQGAWVVTGYIISAVVVIPLTPWLQLRFGRRQYYTVAIIGFTIASMFCGFSHSISSLIFWRVVQGLFGGGLVAIAQATLRDTFPRERLGVSQAIFALGAIVGPTVGPTLGGFLTDNLSWNYVFFINALPGAVAAIVILLRLKNPTEPRRIPLDGIGVALLAVGLGSLQYVLDEGQRNDWFDDPRIVIFTCLAVAGIAAFIVWELYATARPIVDLRTLKYRSVAAGAALTFAIGASLFASTVLLPQYVQALLGFTATLSGELILVRALVLAVLTFPIARLAASGRIDTRILLVTGFSLVAFSNYLQASVTTTETSFWTLGPSLLTAGLGLSLLFTPLSIAVLGSVPPEVAPRAASFTNLALQLGGSFSTAALVTLLSRRGAYHQTILADAATVHSTGVQQFLAQHGSLNQLYGLIAQQATALAYGDASLALAVMTIVLTPLVFVLGRPKVHVHVPISAE